MTIKRLTNYHLPCSVFVQREHDAWHFHSLFSFRLIATCVIRGRLLHAVLEGAHPLAGTTHEFGYFLASEQEENHKENDDDFRHSETQKERLYHAEKQRLYHAKR